MSAKKLRILILIFSVFLCNSLVYAENMNLRVPSGAFDAYSRAKNVVDSSLSMEQRFKKAMGPGYENIRNFRIDARTGRYVFQKALKKKPAAWITYYYENAVPVDLDGSIDDLLALYEESVQHDKRNIDMIYLIFKRIAKFRDKASHLKVVLENIMDAETSDKVLDEIRVAIDMISGRTVDGGKRLRVVYASYEISPFVGKGGIKDIIEQLPRTLHNKRGHEASVFIPYWESIMDEVVERNNGGIRIEEVKGGVFELGGERVEIYTLLMRNELTGDFEPIDGVPIYLLKCDRYFSTEKGDIYRQELDRNMPDGSHLVHPENAKTAIFFSKAVLEAMTKMELRPDVINTADWQTAHIPTLLKNSKDPKVYSFFKNTKTLHTIHNIGPKGLIMASPYAPEGSDARNAWDFMGISDDAYQPDDQNGVEFYGRVSLQKGGIVFADMVSTVGITYASELKTEEFGSGFEDINRASGVIGIPNGIALREWNSATSPSISHRFKNNPSGQDRQLGVLDEKEGKRENKKTMLEMVNANKRDKRVVLREFTCDENTPIFCFLGRFDDQKGLDILLSVLEKEREISGRLEGGRIKMIFAGTGSPEYMRKVKELERAYPESVAYLGWVDEAIAKQLFAGADVNIMPSIFEPKGMVQMQAARFGAINLVNRVGGLRDDIVDFSEEEGGNGYVVDFTNSTKEEAAGLLREAMLRVIGDFGDKVVWDTRVRRVLADSEKFGWDLSCLKYELLFNASIGNYNDLFIRHRVDHVDEISSVSFGKIMTEIDKTLLTRVLDPLTETVMLTGNDAKEFLLRTSQFYHETTICNLDPNPMTVEIDGSSKTLDDIGIVAIRPGSSLLFREIKGAVVVIITQNPEAVSDWYAPYNEENFHDLFKDKGYNESGIISLPEWRQKGVTVIEHKTRENQWTREQEPEWLIDSMVFGANLIGVSMVKYPTDTGDGWVDFREIRPKETYHRHPNEPEGQGNFVEIYYVVEGMATLVSEEAGVLKVTELGPGDTLIAKDEVPHTILAAKGPYKHLIIQIPSVFQYGFRFKESLAAPQPAIGEILEQIQKVASSI